MIRTSTFGRYRPALVFAYVDSAHAARCGRYFRRLGWEVHLVNCASEAVRLAGAIGARVLVMDSRFADDAGRLTLDLGCKIVVSRLDPPEVLADAIRGRRLAEAV